jgi:hypothetical protein
MARDLPIGIKLADKDLGDWDIAKWHNLSNNDKRNLDGLIIGDKRNGPVTVLIGR